MIKIKTEVLKNMLNKAIKVCSFNKMLPLTELMEVSIQNNVLNIRTTDNISNIFLQQKLEDDNQDMRVVVDATLFTSLINKITTEFVELNLTDSSLTIIANGVYNLDLRVDESNEIIKFPEIEINTEEAKEFDLKKLIKNLSICKAAIPDHMDIMKLSNYYLKDRIIATNAFKITSVPNIEQLQNEEILITKQLGKILIDLELSEAKYKIKNDMLTIIGDGLILISKINQDLDRYPLQGIDTMLKEKFDYSIKINRAKILNLLNRLNLFVAEYENNSINLLFKKDKLNITNVKETCNEDINYTNSLDDQFKEFKCIINIVHLKEQLEALISDEVEIYFGASDKAIKIVDGDIIEIISLMQDEQ